jgi:hypothetical protein
VTVQGCRALVWKLRCSGGQFFLLLLGRFEFSFLSSFQDMGGLGVFVQAVGTWHVLQVSP